MENLMNEEKVVALMLSSKSEKEWNNNADKVISANSGYPSFWYRAVEAALIYQKASKNFVAV